MKKTICIVSVMVVMLLMASPVKSTAQDLVRTDKYNICLKAVGNALVTAINPWAFPPYIPGFKLIDPDESRMRPNPRCLDKSEPLKKGSRKMPNKREK